MPGDQHGGGDLEATEVSRLAEARGETEYNEPFTRPSPLVSVCVATANRAEFLAERCLPSLLRQTYRNLDIVVVGDGCTDDTALRVGRLRDSRIRFENLPIRGPYPRPGLQRWYVAGSNAMNRALDLASGDFVAHLDDDDQALECRMELLVQAIQAAKVEMVWHRFYCQDERGMWRTLGDGSYALGQITTGSTFYHTYFRHVKWDVGAYTQNVPGDWHRLLRMKKMGMSCGFLAEPLIFHFRERNQKPFKLLHGETFLGDDQLEKQGA
jgi:glycosyltransferase involved in cell wall biosynthesis